ncbi:hypothetical protein [Psychromonas aquimarina]|uniref:hypothetical protein n=1 Tax=Psychromonas aquimarina TaxID=444919 RepID=UPI000429FA41|nr:hypothetical protein [Psychromonas aquimarina]
MTHVHKDLLMTDDELKFFSELIVDIEDSGAKKPEYNISSSYGQDALLMQLGLADDLHLTANYGNHHLVFPVQMKMDSFANFSMYLESPAIFETGERLRSWRLSADRELCLVNEAGEELHYQVNNLSASGISLFFDETEAVNFPEELHDTYLQLPDRQRLSISGSKISRIDDKSIAYSLAKNTDEGFSSVLTEYLCACHAQRYPEVHALQLKR